MLKNRWFKISALIFGGVLLVFLMLSLFAWITYHTYRSSSCERLLEISNNKEKIEYLKKWFSLHANSSQFRSYFTQGEYLSARDNPTPFEKMDLDWEYLGIEKHFAAIFFNKKYAHDGSEIFSISFINGRAAGLVMVIGDVDKLRLSEDEKKHQILTNEKDFYVDCR